MIPDLINEAKICKFDENLQDKSYFSSIKNSGIMKITKYKKLIC